MDDTGLDRKMSDEEWENRVLCSDGSCIGVIGPDGACKECGKPYEGSLEGVDLSGVEDESYDSDVEEEIEDTEDTEDEPLASDDEWDNRRLCSDGNCIGVIGPDNCCKECGKPFEAEGDED